MTLSLKTGDEITRSPVGNFHLTRWNCRGAGPAYVPECMASPRNIDCASIAVAAQNVASETTIPEIFLVILRAAKPAAFPWQPVELRLYAFHLAAALRN